MVAENDLHVLDLLPAYVLDALNIGEFNRVVEHLAGCAACQAEYLSLQKIADELPLALRQSAPPGRVKASLMQAIHERKAGTRHPTGLTFWQKLGRIFSRPLITAGAALILILAVSNVWLLNQNRRLSELSNQPWQVVTLVNPETSSSASGILIIDSMGQKGTLLVDNLAALGSAQQYQVWLIRSSERVSAGVFSVNQQGHASLIIQASDPLTNYEAIGISVEPFGGSINPTGARVLDGTIGH